MTPAAPPSPGLPRAAEGTPYHLLQRTERHRWWRPLLSLLLLAVLWMAFMLVVTVVGEELGALNGIRFDASGSASDPVWELALTFLALATGVPAVLLTVRWVQRRPAGTVSSVEGRIRWRWLLHCTSWALLGLAVITAFDLVRGKDWNPAAWPGLAQFLVLVAITLAVVPFQSAAEEYLCRGLLLQGFASWLRNPWPGAVLTSLGFVALHEYTDALVLIDLFVFGMALCWVTIRTGGLEAAIALHMVNNVTGTILESTQGVPSLDQTGDYSTWDVLPMTVLTVVYAWWIDRRARSAGISR